MYKLKRPRGVSLNPQQLSINWRGAFRRAFYGWKKWARTCFALVSTYVLDLVSLGAANRSGLSFSNWEKRKIANSAQFSIIMRWFNRIFVLHLFGMRLFLSFHFLSFLFSLCSFCIFVFFSLLLCFSLLIRGHMLWCVYFHLYIGVTFLPRLAQLMKVGSIFPPLGQMRVN